MNGYVIRCVRSWRGWVVDFWCALPPIRWMVRKSCKACKLSRARSLWIQPMSGASLPILELPQLFCSLPRNTTSISFLPKPTSRKNCSVADEIKSFFLHGPAGKLEALLHAGSPQASHAALVCHPHPLHGGTLHNKLVFNAMKALNGLGFPALRFNFRGAGLSEGTHDHGHGEVEDVRAALDWLGREFQLPIIFDSFSFRAAVGLRACCPDIRVVGLVSLGTPVAVEGRLYAYNFLHDCAKSKLFISSAPDQFVPFPELHKLI